MYVYMKPFLNTIKDYFRMNKEYVYIVTMVMFYKNGDSIVYMKLNSK